MSAIRFWQSLGFRSSLAYHQRACACENDSGRIANESQWQAFVIDGGFSKAYQPETELRDIRLFIILTVCSLCSISLFQSRQKAIEEGLDIKSTNFVLEFNSQRMMVKDTDKKEKRTGDSNTGFEEIARCLSYRSDKRKRSE